MFCCVLQVLVDIHIFLYMEFSHSSPNNQENEKKKNGEEEEKNIFVENIIIHPDNLHYENMRLYLWLIIWL